MVLLMLLVATAYAVPPEIANPHFGRDLVFEPNEANFKASLGGEFGASAVVDNTKTAGGGEARIYSYFRLKGDLTHQLNPSDILGVQFEVIEPDSSLVELEDDRENRIRARSYFYGPQFPTMKGYWRHTSEHQLWELGVGRDRFLGYDQLLGEYQGSMPPLLKYTQWWDNGVYLRHERYAGEKQLYSLQASILDSEGWVGMEDRWFSNSYFRFGAQGEIHILHLLSLTNWGDLSLLGSWTNAEGGSASGGGRPGAKESFEHLLYGIQYSHNLWGLDFKTRFLSGEITCGKNHNNHEETVGWAWETLLGGFECGKSFVDLCVSVSNAEYDGGEKFWLWKGSATHQDLFKFGIQVREAFGIENLTIMGEYFKSDMDGHSSWRTLGEDDGVIFNLKYNF